MRLEPGLQDRRYLRENQYRTGDNLTARIALHERFSVNRQGWFGWFVDRLALPAHARVLEVGCGTGEVWADQRDRLQPDWRLTLSDFSPGMLAAASRRLTGAAASLTFCVADAQSLPFASETFDAVIANHMLYHVPDRPRALAELRRVLHPDGWLYAATNGRDHLRELSDLLTPYAPGEAWTDRHLGFGLENGAAQLRPWFAEVTREDYPDALDVTEVEPLLAYLRSSPAGAALTPTHIARLRDDIAARIARDGGIHVTKATGLFRGRRAS